MGSEIMNDVSETKATDQLAIDITLIDVKR